LRADHRFREEVINVQLADALSQRGLDATPETIRGAARPDVLIVLDGLKLVLEGRSRTQRHMLMADAKARVEEGVADIAIGVLYPPDLRDAGSLHELTANIAAAHYDGEIFSLGRQGIDNTPFAGASLDELAQTVNSVFRLRVHNDVVREQVVRLEAMLDDTVSRASTTDLFFRSAVLVQRLKQALGIVDDDSDEADADGD
jgi:hypothetical protein